ncbi:hypothetical protein AOL_s00188g346 [Orbilia oligospora ATCC 24927]|uniref:Uncharacterized protein n=1 Tax=Arthrobotrys oligospora (strain ATCC 24927 / CBS 115.81 / DSM 1491) TaxID=756982 RepID=G1XQY4_ARTOA|nr:hypothetical protein AOL_s00188g346 [Orbilia oligospora ATCC 24927]EGX44441.1 hypothetical protein AOL_s00188g346 [Orbilia oligospora ATCC 24927]
MVLHDLGFFNEELGVVAVEVDGGIVGTTASKIFFVKNTTYHFCMYAAKTAILCFYTRHIPETMKRTRVCLWITVATVVLGFVASILLDLLLYIMVYILPVSAIRVLVLPTPQRIGVGITFALGFLCIAFAATVIVFRYVTTSATTIWIVAIFEQTLCVCVACAPALEVLARGCDIRRWKGRMSYNRGKNQDTDSEAGTIDASSRPQSDATIFDQTQNHNLERAPKRVESLLGQEEIEKPHLCKPTHILPKISPVAAYNRQSHDTECQSNSPNSPGYTMSISSIVDFYDLERQLQLDDEKRQATNCSPVLERASSELHQGSNPPLPINLMEKDLESSGSSQRISENW